MATSKEGLLAAVLCCFFSALLVASEKQQTRKLTTIFRCPAEPEACPSKKNDTFVNVAYTKAVGENDTLHYIVSSVGIPGILVAKTPLNSTLELDWKKMFSKDPQQAVSFDPQPLYAYTLLMTRVLEYNDLDDKANLNAVSQNDTFWSKHDLSTLDWSNSSLYSDTKNHVISLKVDADSKHLRFVDNGSLSFTFRLHGTKGRMDDLPHLAYTKDSGYFDFVLDNVNTTFENSRFALEMAFVTADKDSAEMDIITSKSIDDEHTPGVFELFDWVSNRVDEAKGSYVQWKPVCYTLPKRSITAITKAKNYDLKRNMTISGTKNSLAYMYFGGKIYANEVAQTMTNVSFGLSKDKFYKNNKYSVWSASMGYGQPPKDEISTTIIVVILCGVGIPAALIIFGGLAVCMKKRRDRHKGYEDLSESDVAVNT